MYKSIITTNELAKIVNHHHVKTLDCTMGIHRDDVFASIGTAQHFDIDDICDPHSLFPHMLPSKYTFEKKVQKLGLHNDDQIIVYDQNGFSLAASRVWWMFRVFGHDNIAVLDGGLPQWQAQGHEIYSGIAPTPMRGDFKVKEYRAFLVRTFDEIQTNLQQHNDLVIDVRDPERFEGRIPDARVQNTAGHIPGSKNLPFLELLEADCACFKSLKDIENKIQKAGLGDKKNLVASCGSGVTACVFALALYNLGNENVAVYDGSWTEWGSLSEKIETGRAS